MIHQAVFVKKAGEFAGKLWCGNGDDVGMMAFDLREEFGEIGACSQCYDLELVGEGFDDVKSLAAYGAGGA